MSDIKVESLFPSSMKSLTIPQFLEQLPTTDQDFAKRHANAQIKGSVLRYVASIKDSTVSVGLQAVPEDSPIGSLKGTDNILQVHTDIYVDQPLVIQGSGAGLDITAAGVLADLVDLASKY